jgi:TonB-dependent starch-binding outer membrane protein SusC
MPFKTNVLAVCACTAMFILFSCSLFAQKTVTGRVTSNADKQPLVGATVQIKGTKIATQTGPDGTFTISSPKDINELLITVVGFEALQVPVAGRSSLGDIVVSLSNSSLNDVIVTGYTSQKKKDITGAVAVVNVKDMKSIVSGNVEQQLQGQAAGVQVISSGMPGGYTQVNIRGITSFGNNDPLVVIDGVQASMHDINSNDIESVQVLKDAGSAAIYGVQGSNGVIVITTKKGRPGKVTISYDGYYGTQRPLSGNPFNLLDANGLMQLTQKVNAANGGVSALYGPNYVIPDFMYGNSSGGFVAMAGDPAVDPSKYNFDESNPANDYLIAQSNKSGTDWFHAIYKPAPIQNHTITASGATDRSSFLFSFNYFNQQGTLINTYLKRYAVRMNTVFNVKKNIRIGENAYVFFKQQPPVTGSSNQNEGSPISWTYREQPIIPVLDIMGHYAGTFNGPELGNAQNPVANQQRTANNVYNTWDVIGNVFAEADFLKHFTIRTSAGGTIDNQYSWNFTYNDYNDVESHESLNQFNEQSQFNSTLLWTNTLAYNNVFAEKHALKVLIGSESKNVYGRGLGGGGNSLFSTDPAYWILSNATQNITNYSYAYKSNLFSLFGRLDYEYNDKYLLAATVRRDGASVLGANDTYGVFPSVSLGWRLSSENFMKDISWINELKIRGSWGKLGSINNVNANNQFNLFGQNFADSYYDINGTNNSVVGGFYQTQIGNPNTAWEQDKITNIGFDAVLFHNKFDLSAEWYEKDVDGLLQPAQLQAAGIGNGPAPTINSGSIKNTGVDIAATYHGTIDRDWRFNIGVNITAYKNQVISVPGTGYFDAGASRIGTLVRNQGGHPVGSFFGYKVIGMFQDSTDVLKSPVQQDAAPGRFKYQDVDGNDTINASDRQFFGNPNPKFTYGLNLNVSYKNFDLTAIFYGVEGNDILNYVKYFTDFYDAFAGNKNKDLLNNSWSPSNPNAKVPTAQNASTFSTDGVPNSFFMEKGSFFRCKSLIIGYNVTSPAILRKAGIDRFRIYVQGSNLFTVTKYSGPDPELQSSGSSTTNPGNNPSNAYSSSFGIDYGNYPNNQKTYLVGLSFAF